MRRHSPRHVSLVLLAALAGCDLAAHPPSGGPVDGGPGVVDGAADDATLLPPTSAGLWLTTADGVTLLAPQPEVAFASPGAGDAPAIVVDDTVRMQEIDGFGASLTESSAYVLMNHMSAAARTALLRRFFDRDEGIGLRVLRQPMGASDFAIMNYSYDDTPPDLSDFSIAHDRATIIPILKEIRAINPDLLLIASPWSPPGWMKTSGSMLSGELAAAHYDTLADYFVEFVRAYTDEGLPIYAVTPQNEPHFVSGSYPGMRMEAADQARFVGEKLGPALAAAGLGATKILVWDHNWDEPQYALEVLANPAAASYAAGTAFHCYAGDVSAQRMVHDTRPDKDIWFTECSSTEGSDPFDNYLADTGRLVIETTRNWARSVIKWNLVLDDARGPTNNGCRTCYGVAEVKAATGAVTLHGEYYALGHASKFVRPGARRVASETEGQGAGSANLRHVAFRNPDGGVVLVVLNDGPTGASFRVETRGVAAAVELPAGAMATLVW